MQLKHNWIAFYSMWVFIVFFTITGFILIQFRHSSRDIGERVLKIMYTFDDLEELNSNYAKLDTLIDESLWDDFSLNNDSRVISAYYKFKNSPTRVEIIYSGNNFLVYRLKNDNLPEDNLYLFEYEVEDNKLIVMKEYEIVGTSTGKVGVIG